MVRGKTNIIVKDKGRAGKALGTLPTVQFPDQRQSEFHNTRILLSDKSYESSLYKQDISLLREDHREHVSS